MGGDGGVGEIQHRRHLADAQLAVFQHGQDPQPHRVAQGLVGPDRLGERRIGLLDSQGVAGLSHSGEPGPHRELSEQESRPPGGTARLGIVIGEQRPFAGNPVDVGRGVGHAVGIGTER